MRPAVVWALDSASYDIATQWRQGLDPDSKWFCEVVESSDGLRKFVKRVNTTDWVEDSRRRDYELYKEGIHLVVIGLAYGMGAAADEVEWRAYEKTLGEVGREVQNLHDHRVLWFRCEDHAEEERTVKLPPSRRIPWVISSRTDSGLRASESGTTRVIGQVLRLLALAEYRPKDPAFGTLLQLLNAERNGEQVRVVGVPLVDLSELRQEIVATVTSSVLLDGLVEDSRNVTEGRKAEIRTEVRGLVTATDSRNFLKWFEATVEFDLEDPRRAWMRVLPLSDFVIRDLKNIRATIQGSVGTVAAGSERETSKSAHGEAERGGCVGTVLGMQWWAEWVRVALAWFRRRDHEETRVAVTRVSADDVNFALARVEAMRNAFNKFGRDIEAQRPEHLVAPPREIRDAILRAIREALLEQLRAYSSADAPLDGLFGAASDATSRAIEDRLSEAVTEWGVKTKRVTEFEQRRGQGTMFRHYGMVRGNGVPEVECVCSVASIDGGMLPDAESRIVQLQVLPRSEPFVLSVSVPVPVAQLDLGAV